MSPLYANRFAGHQRTYDPRTCVTGAGGCDWCTYPAARYLLVSDNAWGVYGMLTTTGLLIQQLGPFPGHDLMNYLGPIPPIPEVFVATVKEMRSDRVSWLWHIMIVVPQCPFANLGTFGPFTGPCNVDVPLGDMLCSDPYMGGTGSDFQMLQVEYHRSLPPGGYP